MTGLDRTRRRRQGGQSMVEFALAMPLLLLLVGGSYTVWNGLQDVIGVTSAARAGALTAANQLAAAKVKPAVGPGAPYTAAQLNAVAASAASAVSAEDGTTTYFAAPCSAGVPCVTIGSTNVPTGGGTYLPEVTITVSQVIKPTVALVSSFTVTASAACPAAGG